MFWWLKAYSLLVLLGMLAYARKETSKIRSCTEDCQLESKDCNRMCEMMYKKKAAVKRVTECVNTCNMGIWGCLGACDPGTFVTDEEKKEAKNMKYIALLVRDPFLFTLFQAASINTKLTEDDEEFWN